MIKKISSDQKGQEKKGLASAQTRKHFTEPRLKFIKPKLTKCGDVTSITGSSPFGTFDPPGFPS